MSEQTTTTGIKASSLGVCFAKTARSWGIFVIVLTVVYIIVTVSGQREIGLDAAKSPAAPTVCMPETGNNYCAPVDDHRVLAAVVEQETAGLTCSAKSALTGTIMFQFSADKVVSFNQAVALVKPSQGWVQAFYI